MDITPLTPKDRRIINRYGDGGFVVSEVHFKGNMLVLPDQVLQWDAADMALADEASFAPVLAHTPLPEILLIGTGSIFLPLPPALQTLFRKRHIAADAMDTGAACRTYNVLLAEDRRVACALIAV
jgi:uncharacterized protein